MAKHSYTFSDGHTEQLTEKQSWDGLRKRGACQWSRIGRFAIVLFSNEDVAVCEYYDSDTLEEDKGEKKIAKDDPVYPYLIGFKKDRLKLGLQVEMILMRELMGIHPMAEQIIEAIEKERNKLRKELANA